MQKGAVNHNTSTPWSFQAHSKKVALLFYQKKVMLCITVIHLLLCTATKATKKQLRYICRFA